MTGRGGSSGSPGSRGTCSTRCARRSSAYAVLTLADDRADLDVPAVHTDLLLAAADPEAVVTPLADPAIALVTLTVTERATPRSPATTASTSTPPSRRRTSAARAPLHDRRPARTRPAPPPPDRRPAHRAQLRQPRRQRRTAPHPRHRVPAALRPGARAGRAARLVRVAGAVPRLDGRPHRPAHHRAPPGAGVDADLGVRDAVAGACRAVLDVGDRGRLRDRPACVGPGRGDLHRRRARLRGSQDPAAQRHPLPDRLSREP